MIGMEVGPPGLRYGPNERYGRAPARCGARRAALKPEWPSRAPPMSPTRWQIEPPPLAPGAGAQWLIAALVALGPFSLTMYQPALPSIATSLNITTAQVQLTLTVYLASFAIGQLIYGPLSESNRESGRGAPSLEREFDPKPDLTQRGPSPTAANAFERLTFVPA